MEAQVAAVGEVALPAAGGRAALAEVRADLGCWGVEHEEDSRVVLAVREVVQVGREALEVGAGVGVTEKEAQPSERRRAWQRRSD